DRRFPVIQLTPIRAASGDGDFTPVVSRIRRDPFQTTTQFDVYFYNLSDPRAVPVTSRMIAAGRFFFKNPSEIDPSRLELKDLVRELDQRERNRVPILDRDGKPLYIVHRSMIDKFIASRALDPVPGRDPARSTLADLLDDPNMKRLFTETFVVVR